jgi:hypothetical protein
MMLCDHASAAADQQADDRDAAPGHEDEDEQPLEQVDARLGGLLPRQPARADNDPERGEQPDERRDLRMQERDRRPGRLPVPDVRDVQPDPQRPERREELADAVSDPAGQGVYRRHRHVSPGQARLAGQPAERLHEPADRVNERDHAPLQRT